MDLFNNETGSTINLLPKDGTANYYGRLFTKAEADHFLHCLLTTIDWKNDEAIIFGKLVITKRKVAWYGDQDFEYTYSNTTKKALPWTKLLLELKAMAEEHYANLLVTPASTNKNDKQTKSKFNL